MHGSTRILIVAGLLICVLAVSPRVLWADVAGGVLLAAAEPAAEDADGVDGADDEVFDEDEEFEKETPLRIKLDYTLVTDYVWRGFNLTEYPGEGTERPSHQFGIDLALDLTELAGSEANLGHAGARVWIQCYSGYLAQTAKAAAAAGTSASSGDHLQQVDYTLYWDVDFERVVEVEVGLTYRTWPRLKSMSLPAGLPPYNNGDEATTEIYLKAKFDDSDLFGRDMPLLSPSVYYGLDIDETDEGSWIEIGIEHEFNFRDLGVFEEATPMRHFTVTPSVILGIDHRYLDTFGRFARRVHQKADRLAFLSYGLDFSYDLSSALQMRPEHGKLKLGAFVNFSDALREDLLNDELYGGFMVGYEW